MVIPQIDTFRLSPQFQEAYSEGFDACRYIMIQVLETQLKFVKNMDRFETTATTNSVNTEEND